MVASPLQLGCERKGGDQVPARAPGGEDEVAPGADGAARHGTISRFSSTSPLEAFELLAKHSVQVVISDQRMPDMSGTEFLSRVRQIYPATIRLVLTGYTDLQSVTDAINHGAIYKFLTKPWDDDQLREQIREAFRMAHLNEEQSFSENSGEP